MESTIATFSAIAMQKMPTFPPVFIVCTLFMFGIPSVHGYPTSVLAVSSVRAM